MSSYKNTFCSEKFPLVSDIRITEYILMTNSYWGLSRTNFQCKYFTQLKYSSLPTLNGAHFYYTKFLGFSFYLHTNLNVGQLLSILSGTRSMQLLCGQCALLFTVCGTVQHFSNTDFSLDNIENISNIAIVRFDSRC